MVEKEAAAAEPAVDEVAETTDETQDDSTASTPPPEEDTPPAEGEPGAVENQTSDGPKKRKRVANANHPTIEAVINVLFRFESEAQAKERMDTIAENFVISKEQEEVGGLPAVKLWIRGYNLQPGQEKEGYLGHFAYIRYGKTPDGKFSLFAEPIDTELKFHPQKKRRKQRHPNWGHPILRGIKKGKIYPTVEDARDAIQALHEEYPDVTIPTMNKLYAIIYSRAEPGEKPIKKWVLEIEVHDEGGYIFKYYENTYQKKELPGVKEGGDITETAPQGKFTSQVALKKKVAPRGGPKADQPLTGTAKAAAEKKAKAEAEAAEESTTAEDSAADE